MLGKKKPQGGSAVRPRAESPPSSSKTIPPAKRTKVPAATGGEAPLSANLLRAYQIPCSGKLKSASISEFMPELRNLLHSPEDDDADMQELLQGALLDFAEVGRRTHLLWQRYENELIIRQNETSSLKGRLEAVERELEASRNELTREREAFAKEKEVSAKKLENLLQKQLESKLNDGFENLSLKRKLEAVECELEASRNELTMEREAFAKKKEVSSKKLENLQQKLGEIRRISS